MKQSFPLGKQYYSNGPELDKSGHSKVRGGGEEMDDSDEGDDDADWVEVDEVGEEALDCKETYEERCHPDKVGEARTTVAANYRYNIFFVFSRSLATAPSPASSSPPSTAPRSTLTRTFQTPGAGRSAGPCAGRRHGKYDSKTYTIPTYLY